MGGQKGTIEQKKKKGEKGIKRKDGRGSRILFHIVIIMKSFHSICDDGGFQVVATLNRLMDSMQI